MHRPRRQHGDDVDHGGVEVEQVGEAEQRDERAGDRRDRAEHREARGEEAAEHHDHHGEAHRQGDALAALAVGLDLRDDPVDQAAQAAALVAGGAGLLGQPVEDHVDLLGRGGLLLGGVVGVEGDHGGETAGCRVAVEREAQGRGLVGPSGTTKGFTADSTCSIAVRSLTAVAAAVATAGSARSTPVRVWV